VRYCFVCFFVTVRGMRLKKMEHLFDVISSFVWSRTL
jgi:hypothetical protein